MKKSGTLLVALALTMAVGCGDDDGPSTTDAGIDAHVETPDGGPIDPPEDASVDEDSSVDEGIDGGFEPEICDPSEVACQDESVAQMNLHATPAPAGKITEEGETEGEFLTFVDATAGGLSATEAYVYARFTDAGLEQVLISDEDAFSSTGWDIAFRRNYIRLNSGVSGPSCVTGARIPAHEDGTEATFENVTAVPEDLELHSEAYFVEGDEEGCTLIPDGSGLDTAPDMILSGFWRYSKRGCLQMTRNVYALQLRNGRYVKLEVKSYYVPESQELCETTGSAASPSGAGNVRVRWAFLD